MLQILHLTVYLFVAIPSFRQSSQYCSHLYVNLLKNNNIIISMTENGDPYENALAERMNRIIKTEFNPYNSQVGFETNQ
jgi:putative transposase